jgi:hypothetical protein
MRIWVDDVRPMPAEGYDVHAKTLEGLLELIVLHLQAGEAIAFISFDHDMPTTEPLKSINIHNVYDILKYLLNKGAVDDFSFIKDWRVHSMNPVGKKNIEQLLSMKGE